MQMSILSRKSNGETFCDATISSFKAFDERNLSEFGKQLIFNMNVYFISG